MAKKKACKKCCKKKCSQQQVEPEKKANYLLGLIKKVFGHD